MVSVGRPSGELIQLARPVVLSNEMIAMRAAGVLSPAEHQPAHDQLIAVDDRRGDASAMRRPHAELLGQRAFPEQLAVAGQRHQQAVAAEGEDIAARGIDDGRRPGDAVGRHVAREEVVLVLPEQLAGVGVEAHQAFLHRARLRQTCSGGRDDRQRSRVRIVRRTGPSTPGSDPKVTTRTAGRSRSRCRSVPGRASPANRRRAGARPRGSATQLPRRAEDEEASLSYQS